MTDLKFARAMGIAALSWFTIRAACPDLRDSAARRSMKRLVVSGRRVDDRVGRGSPAREPSGANV